MILVHTPSPKEVSAYLELFQAAMPEQAFVSLEQATPDEVRYLIAWGLPDGIIARLPRLQAMFALGAGVDKLLSRQDLPVNLPLYRLLDSGMANQMTEYIRYGVLGYQRNMDVYRRQQATGQWRMLAPRLPEDVRVGILGLGEIGSAVAKALARDGYPVSGWSRGPKHIHHVHSLHGEAGLEKLLETSDVIASVLPSTPQTQGLLNGARLSLMQPGSMLINAGRGDLLDQDALLALLNNGHIRCAQLDVFAEEPLPHGHPLWHHPSVTITPHVAAITLRQQAVEQIVGNLRKLAAGLQAEGRVERAQGY
ncbi:glyoxylate/hydroxypyruvate reductase A [Chromobacterium phragmitis]|uniref:Glyoxylate/hydroxypyruvate reductase A n=1 Tax=Chromobacterium phragmitis TaxID=2202141 RepID=A0A344UMX5_9NEIS|nr:glyoxylate/hydroxypyruvate reductase A [Chromobacterium phragmitis]AXE31238.1 glyoxylate/hydroxypyruvate reductase A [Chromobacterium phragmitis]AXE36623.1 glyoxylate/hydroxypyruvate reductase A [Chromobacterium phragmitis]